MTFHGLSDGLLNFELTTLDADKPIFFKEILWVGMIWQECLCFDDRRHGERFNSAMEDLKGETSSEKATTRQLINNQQGYPDKSEWRDGE